MIKCPHCEKEIVIVCGESSSAQWGIRYKDVTGSVGRTTYLIDDNKEGALKWFKESYPGLEVVEVWRELVVR